jgi:hypothetical protein
MIHPAGYGLATQPAEILPGMPKEKDNGSGSGSPTPGPKL